MTLPALDAFLAFAQADGTLAERLHQPLELEELLALGRSHGFEFEAEDVLAAQQREEASLAPPSCNSGPGRMPANCAVSFLAECSPRADLLPLSMGCCQNQTARIPGDPLAGRGSERR